MGRRGGKVKEILGGGMKEAVSKKKDTHKAICWNSTEENKRRCKTMQIKQFQKQIEKAEEALTE